MNYQIAHSVKLGHTQVKSVDLIIATEAVVDPISCYSKMEGGEIADKAESTYTMQPVQKLCPEEMESHTREYADLPERHVDSQFTRRTGTNLSQVVIILPQGRKIIKYKWVLWDACSFKSVSKNPKMMRDIKECNGICSGSRARRIIPE